MMAKSESKSKISIPAPEGTSPYFASEDNNFVLYKGDCLELMPAFPEESIDMIFADPPYFLSNGGITCHAGKMVSVNKGKWDRSMGFKSNYEFTLDWIKACKRLLKPNGSIWISGTSHIIHIVGCCLDELGYKILNDITWVKKNPPPNLSCRYFTHATETILWAGRDKKCKHKFNYKLMKRINNDKQMKSVWEMDAPKKDEKIFGKHPTQKPLGLLERIIAASTDENDLVLDPFSGSATTGIAAIILKRKFSGLELENSFLNLGISRLEGIPQADKPLRILDIVRHHSCSICSICELAIKMKLTERQIYYYRRAGELLGLLSRSNKTWKRTKLGESLCDMPQNQAKSILAKEMNKTPIFQAAKRIVRKYKNDIQKQKKAISDLLERSSLLGKTTCGRRAKTLISWIDFANEYDVA